MAYEFEHHGIRGQKWGQRNGPPYPLGAGDHSTSERKAGWRKSLNKTNVYSDAHEKRKATKYTKELNKADKNAAKAMSVMLRSKVNYDQTLQKDDARYKKIAESASKDPEKDRKKILSIYKNTIKAGNEYKLSQEQWLAAENKLKSIIETAKKEGYSMSNLPKDYIFYGKTFIDSLLKKNGTKAVIRGSEWTANPSAKPTQKDWDDYDKYSSLMNSDSAGKWRRSSHTNSPIVKKDPVRNELLKQYGKVVDEFLDIEANESPGYLNAITAAYAAEAAIYNYDKEKGYYKD